LSVSSTHAGYLAQLGIAEIPLSSPLRRRCSPGRGSKTIGVFCENDLTRLNGQIFWRFHTDEVREGRTVMVNRGLAVVARIECATEALAWDAERICAGIRFKRGAD
jgi:hypothetical protein